SSSSNGGICLSPSYSSSSTPDGSCCAAARSRRELCESRRSDPDTARIRIDLRLLTSELELDGELDVIGNRHSALGQRGVPREAVLRAVDHRLERDAELGYVAEGDRRTGDRAGRLERVGLVLDREVSGDLQRAVVSGLDLRGVEANLRIALDVEEVRRAEVGLQVLILYLERIDLHGAGAAR